MKYATFFKVILSGVMVASSSSALLSAEVKSRTDDAGYVDAKLKYLDEEIAKLEGSYKSIGKRRAFSGKIGEGTQVFGAKPSNTSNADFDMFDIAGLSELKFEKFSLAENCYLGVGVEMYNPKGELVRREAGPINLRHVIAIDSPDYDPKRDPAFILQFRTKDERPQPKLYFKTRDHRDEAAEIFTKLRHVCHQRWSFFKKHKPDLPKPSAELKVPDSTDLAGRVVRFHEDDETMRAALLSDGKDSFAARLAISKQAFRPGDSLKVEYLIYSGDEAGIRLSNELIQRREKGVNVEVIIDALSPALDIRSSIDHTNTFRMYRNLMAAGIPVYGFRCASTPLGDAWRHLFDEAKLSMRVGSATIDHRPHEKFWIVNGRTAVIGGMNIGNDYFRLNKPGFGFWRDQDILVEGKEIIQDMVNIFDSNVKSYVANFTDPRKDSCFNPYKPVVNGGDDETSKEEELKYQKFKARHSKAYAASGFFGGKHRDKNAHAKNEINRIEARIERGDFKPDWEYLKAARIVHNRPKLRELHIEDTYIDLIDNAREEVIISNAYLIPSENLKTAFRRAARRGVRVVIMSNSEATNDIPTIPALARHGYKEMVDENYGRDGLGKDPMREVEIWEWTGDKNRDGVLEQGMNHAKFLVVDRKIVFIGSYNLDPRSRNINSEVGIVFEGMEHKLGQQLGNQFSVIDRKLAVKIEYSEMLNARKPLDFFEAAALKMQGYYLDDDLVHIGKTHLFLNVAEYNYETW